MLCDPCKSLVSQSLSWSTQGKPQWLEFPSTGYAERTDLAALGCVFCSLSIRLEPTENVDTSGKGAPFPASFWWCGRRYEIFEPGRLTDAQDYESIQHGQDNYRFTNSREIQRDVPTRTNDPSSLALVTKWMRLCTTKHMQCIRKATTELPTRVIDVSGARGGSDVRLVESEGRSGTYVALSHRWGDGQPLTTTTKNLHKHKEGIPIASLPQTFRDAVTTLRAVGVQYLWIDSLCILQDSVEDWANEATKMADVYSNALFTISASSANSAKDGLFRTRPAVPTALFAWSFPSASRQPIILGLRPSLPSFDEEMQASPLGPRGWIYQERLLSSAILHFGRETLFWECKTAVLSQSIPVLPEAPPAISRHFSDLGFMSQDFTRQFWRAFAQFTAEERSWQNGPCGWKDVVKTFSKKTFTKPTDRYAAILGVASKFRELTSSNFRAGLWMSDIMLELAWAFDEKAGIVPSVASKDQERLRSPSWSWISVDYPITWLYDVEERGNDVQDDQAAAALNGGDGRDTCAEDLVAYSQRSTEQFTLRLRERMAQPTNFEAVEKEGGRIHIIMEKRRNWEVHELTGMLDPGRELPKKLHLLRLIHSNGMILDDAAIFLILKRVGMPNKEVYGDLGSFKRIGIGTASFEKMQDFFAFGREGLLFLV